MCISNIEMLILIILGLLCVAILLFICIKKLKYFSENIEQINASFIKIKDVKNGKIVYDTKTRIIYLKTNIGAYRPLIDENGRLKMYRKNKKDN